MSEGTRGTVLSLSCCPNGSTPARSGQPERSPRRECGWGAQAGGARCTGAPPAAAPRIRAVKPLVLPMNLRTRTSRSCSVKPALAEWRRPGCQAGWPPDRSCKEAQLCPAHLCMQAGGHGCARTPETARTPQSRRCLAARCTSCKPIGPPCARSCSLPGSTWWHRAGLFRGLVTQPPSTPGRSAARCVRVLQPVLLHQLGGLQAQRRASPGCSALPCSAPACAWGGTAPGCAYLLVGLLGRHVQQARGDADDVRL